MEEQQHWHSHHREHESK